MTTMPDSSGRDAPGPQILLDLWLRVVQHAPDKFEVAVTSPVEARWTFQTPFDPVSESYQLGFAPLSEQTLRSVGSRLFDLAFGEPIRAAYRRAQALGLGRIRISLDGEAASSLPWEALYDTDNEEFVGAGGTPIVRSIPAAEPQLKAGEPAGLRVLGIVVPDVPGFDPDRERQIVDGSIEELLGAGRIDWTWQSDLTFDGLRRSLTNDGWTAVHYVGNPWRNPESGPAFAFGSGEPGRTTEVDVRSVGDALRAAGVRLVTMTMPATAAGSGSHINIADTPEALVRQGVPAAVANRFSLAGTSMTRYLRAYYGALADEAAIDAAVEAGRTQLREVTGRVGWFAPVVYANTPDAVRFRSSGGNMSQARTAPSPTALSDQPEQLDLERILNDRALRRVTEILRQGATGERSGPTVVAISGPRASGKTYVALRAANQVRDVYPGGPAHVSLSDVNAPGEILRGVFPELSGRSPGGADVLKMIDERRLVVILDDVESSRHAKGFLPRSNRSALIVVSESPVDLPNAAQIHLEPVSREGIEEVVRRLTEVGGRALPGDTTERLLRLQPTELRAELARMAALVGTTLEGLVYPDRAAGGETPPLDADDMDEPTADQLATVAAMLTPSAFSRAAMANDMVGLTVTDNLGVEDEVRALAWIAAARDIDPPLSIGLFGAWGTGKSTFMRLMQAEIKTIAGDAQELRATGENYPACEYVRQITFNAWHYADANLWASLVTYIFEELAKPDGDTGSSREYANLVSQLDTTRALREDAQQRKSLAAQERDRRIEQLDGVRRDRADTAKSLRQGSVDPELVLRDPELRTRAAQLKSVVASPETIASNPVPDRDALSAWLMTVLSDTELVQRAFDAIQDEAIRKNLQDIVRQEEVIRAIGNVARDPTALAELVATLTSAAAGAAGDPAVLTSTVNAFEATKAKRISNPETVSDDAMIAAAFAAIGAGLGAAYRNAAILGSIATDLWSIGGQVRTLGRLVWTAARARWLWLLLGVAAVGVAVGGIALAVVNAGAIAGWVTGVAGAIGAIAAFWKIFQKPIATIRTMLDFAVDAVKARGRTQIDALAAQEQAIQREIEQATHDEHEAERELEDIRQGRRLYRYIEERAKSSDYKPYLGVIAQVRKDFETLADLMQDGRTARDVDFARRAAERAAGKVVDAKRAPPSPDGQPLPAIDRVILYIDDLDRCPVDRVVMVLEAVHLLLALKLFVVVVGVDPRWLMRSLRQHYAAQLAPAGSRLSSWEGDRDYWNSTPENYLEKIFQIPFSLRPMSQDGYVELMTSVLGELKETPSEEEVGDVATKPTPDLRRPDHAPTDGSAETTTVPPAPAADSSQPTGAPVPGPSPEPPLDAGSNVQAPGQAESAVAAVPEGSVAEAAVGQEATTETPPQKTYVAAPAELRITKAEFDFIARLRDFVDTPRSAKRLANTYRLIKVLPTPRDATIANNADAEFQIPLLLLSIVIGFPSPAGVIFRELLDAKDATWPAFRKRVVNAKLPMRPTTPGSSRSRNGSRAAASATRSATASSDGRSASPPADAERTADWVSLAEALTDLEQGGALPRPLGPYRSWARLVGRFSFEIGRVTTVESDDDGESPTGSTASTAPSGASAARR